MKTLLTITFSLLAFFLHGQESMAGIKGQLQDAEGEAIPFANVALYSNSDSSLVKVETTDETGVFTILGINAGRYYMLSTFIGSPDLWTSGIQVKEGQQLDLGVLKFEPAAVELAQATVTATRALVEIKPDRTVFNVEGTINSVGSNALDLLRKAPGVIVDNNNNISVLGRSGVLLYVDGKRLPITGDALTNYLENLPAEQIDRFDIITNPGAKYEAEGNAGIVDIRLKKDENIGANGNVSSTYSQGVYARSNLNASGNYRNKLLNAFGTVGVGDGGGFNEMEFYSFQNGFIIDEEIKTIRNFQNYNYRFGTDFYLGKNHILGFLVGGGENTSDASSLDVVDILNQATPSMIDSVLIAENTEDNSNNRNTFNINYRFSNKKGQTLNIDADYGTYKRESERFQPNLYYSADRTEKTSEVINAFDTPSEIDIYTFKVDYEQNILGGKLGLGTKFSKVVSDNTFLFFDVINDEYIQNNFQSNIFEYDENVYAGYVNFARQLGEQWSFSAGLRAEKTVATGDLQAFLPELQEPPVEFDYLSWFPSAGLTWNVAPKHTLALNYGRRINRPDYNVLNPFNNRLSELSYEKGNPFLRPEIVNNVELGYTLNYRYNFKLAYSKTTDQITRLIAPDGEDPRAGFITWDNLASQTIVSLNVSLPMQLTPFWSAYFNLSGSYLDNQADYGDGAIVDVQAYTYNIFQQHTFKLPHNFTGEISSYYSGPGVWGGVFEYDSNWSLDIGLQRQFFKNKLNVKLSVRDIFYETQWSGTSSFDGLVSNGAGRWDSRRGSLSLSYKFGNDKIKSRKRKTGIEEEADRVGN